MSASAARAERATGSPPRPLSLLTQAASPAQPRRGDGAPLGAQGWDRASIFRVLTDLADDKLPRRLGLRATTSSGG
ncbi:MAG: hypothetical protein IPI35_22530 [Deltaproteobacteria bacterium]|nr:hypothetical protein [Deltaproteobacteria bacterium]